ncbi:hypothetical protein ABIE78_002449 [Sinorhizobium fredii]
MTSHKNGGKPHALFLNQSRQSLSRKPLLWSKSLPASGGMDNLSR